MSSCYGSYVQLPGFSDARVGVWHSSNEAITLIYLGCREDLIAAGLCTDAMLEPRGKGKGSRPPRLDEDDEKYSVDRYSVLREGQPVVRYRVWRWKSRANAQRLLGALEAIAHAEKRKRDREAVEQEFEQRARCKASGARST